MQKMQQNEQFITTLPEQQELYLPRVRIHIIINNNFIRGGTHGNEDEDEEEEEEEIYVFPLRFLLLYDSSFLLISRQYARA